MAQNKDLEQALDSFIHGKQEQMQVNFHKFVIDKFNTIVSDIKNKKESNTNTPKK